MNKKYTLHVVIVFLVIIIPVLKATSQGHNQVMPFHQYLQQHHFDSQQGQSPDRSIVYREIAYRHDMWYNPSGIWDYADSGQFTYNPQALQTMGVYYQYYNSNWNNTENIAYTYDGSGNEISYIVGLWDSASNAFLNYEKVAFTYDSYNDKLSEVDEFWNSTAGNWLNSYKYSYTYDANFRETREVDQNWDSTVNAWTNSSNLIITRDVNGNATANTYQTDSLGTWVNNNQELYTYNGNNQQTTDISQTWNNITSSWDNGGKVTYTLDVNGNITQNLQQIWNTGSNSWYNYYRYSNTYNINNAETQSIFQTWYADSSIWENGIEDQYTYDGNGDSTVHEIFGWNSTTSSWGPTPGYKYNYQYDSNNNMIYSLYEANYDTSLTNSDQYFYYYRSFNFNGIQGVKNELSAAIYPNPSSGGAVNISFGLDQKQQHDAEYLRCSRKNNISRNPSCSKRDKQLSTERTGNGGGRILPPVN